MCIENCYDVYNFLWIISKRGIGNKFDLKQRKEW